MKMRAKASGPGSGMASPRPRAAEGHAARIAREARERARAHALADAADEGALRAFRAGDRSAFDRLVTRHEKGLFNFCFRLLGSRPAAEDATQEILLKVVRSADGWTPKAKVRTWIYAIARNHCIDEARKARHRQTDSLDRPLKPGDDEGATVGDGIADPAEIGPERGAHGARLRGLLLRAIDLLPEEQREVFVMREQVGLPFKEIAEITGVPENTAKSRMRYALEGLRATLAKDGVTLEDADP